jgi:hypothetical protein
MPKIPFEELVITKQKRMKNTGFKQKKHTGLDTETYKGFVKLICAYDEFSTNKEDWKDIKNIDNIIEFLTQEKFRNSFNWFYNIKFDFESIIKYLDKSDLLTLYNDRSVNVTATCYGIKRTYTLNYLDKKFFSIITDADKYFYFYDLYNFLDTSLDKASKKFLHDKKIDTIDSSRLNTDIKYWEMNKADIRKYCIYDAYLTQQLANYFWKILFDNMCYVPKRPFSKGKLSEEYFLSRCYIPTINNFAFNEDLKSKKFGLKILEYAYNSYFGGRFELLKRGYSEKVYCYDIKSAYPYQMSKLIDFTKGTWNKAKKKINPDAYEGFYKCKIDCKEVYFCPIVYKFHDLNLYSNGIFHQFLPKSEIEFIRNTFDNITITIESGYEFFPTELKYPLKDEIEHLYSWKEREEDEDIKYVVKIILNSLYGKTIQITGANKTGKLFNPIYASLITSGTRVKLLELAMQKPESIIMFSTDGVHANEPLKVDSKPALGDFAKDFSGEGVYLMSDVYNLWNNSKTKNKLRGFSLVSEKDIDSAGVLLKDILANMNTPEYHYQTTRPYHLGECLTHTSKRSIDDLNIWGETEKVINVNGDRKRVWDKEFKNGKQCLKELINSLPITLKGE